MNAFLYDVRELTPEADLVLEYAPDVAEDKGIMEDIKTLCLFVRHCRSGLQVLCPENVDISCQNVEWRR